MNKRNVRDREQNHAPTAYLVGLRGAKPATEESHHQRKRYSQRRQRRNQRQEGEQVGYAPNPTRETLRVTASSSEQARAPNTHRAPPTRATMNPQETLPAPPRGLRAPGRTWPMIEISTAGRSWPDRRRLPRRRCDPAQAPQRPANPPVGPRNTPLSRRRPPGWSLFRRPAALGPGEAGPRRALRMAKQID